MSENICMYNKCAHPLGPWQPSGAKVDGCYDIEERTCDKCGGQQTKFRSNELDKLGPELFDKMKGQSDE